MTDECTSDDDCPVARICISSLASWNVRNVSYCECNPYFGWVGPDCMEFSARTWVMASNAIVQMVFSLLVTLILVMDLAQVSKAFGRKIPFLTPFVALEITAVGSLAMFLWRLFVVVGTLVPQLNSRLQQGPGSSSSPNRIITATAYLQVIAASTLYTSVLVVSVVWAMLAQASLVQRKKNYELKYKYVVRLLVFTFVVFTSLCAAFGRFDISTVATTPLLLILLLQLLYGRRQISKTLRIVIEAGHETSLAPGGLPGPLLCHGDGHGEEEEKEEEEEEENDEDEKSGGENGKNKDQGESAGAKEKFSSGTQPSPKVRRGDGDVMPTTMIATPPLQRAPSQETLPEVVAPEVVRRSRRALRRVNLTSWFVIIGIVFCIGSGVAYLLANLMAPAGWVEFANPNGFPFTNLAGVVLSWSMVYLFMVIGAYIHVNTSTLVSVQLARVAALAGSEAFFSSAPGEDSQDAFLHDTFVFNYTETFKSRRTLADAV